MKIIGMLHVLKNIQQIQDLNKSLVRVNARDVGNSKNMNGLEWNLRAHYQTK